MRKILFAVLLALIHPCWLLCQEPLLLTSNPGISLRGLSAVNDSIIWVSGSKGMVARSADGGQSWKWINIKGFEKRDFRDIEAFDAHTAIIIAVAEPAVILRTADGGENWVTVFTDSTKGMFLDAMDFYDSLHGIVVGDPIDGHFFLAMTEDGGKSWKKWPAPIAANPGEAFFASSGTNISFNSKGFLLASGGKSSRFITPQKIATINIIQGAESTGANSLAVWDASDIFIAGGDFSNDKDTTKNALYTNDGGATWHRPATPPHGYRSCVEYITRNKMVSCGTSGVDISTDGGMNWTLVTPAGFHVCRKARNGNSVFVAGSNGRIAKLGRF